MWANVAKGSLNTNFIATMVHIHHLVLFGRAVRNHKHKAEYKSSKSAGMG